MDRSNLLGRARVAAPKLSLLCLIVSMVGCDHATKYAATEHLAARAPVDLLPGFLDLRYTENRDTAFSIFRQLGIQADTRALGVVALGVTILLAVLWWRRRNEARWVEHVGFALALAGAIGNVADRLGRGFVVDFIHVHAWPVFNVADVSVVAGAGLLLLSSTFARPPSTPRRTRVRSPAGWETLF